MSKKDFDREYTQIENQYLEMLQDIKEIEEGVSDEVVDPELLERLKTTIQPILNNYNVWSYIKYVLDKPVKRGSKVKYNNHTKKLQSHMKDKTTIIKENNDVLSSLKEMKQ